MGFDRSKWLNISLAITCLTTLQGYAVPSLGATYRQRIVCCSLNHATARRTPPPPLPNPPERYTAAAPGVAIGAGTVAYPARQRARCVAPQYVWVELATA